MTVHFKKTTYLLGAVFLLSLTSCHTVETTEPVPSASSFSDGEKESDVPPESSASYQEPETSEPDSPTLTFYSSKEGSDVPLEASEEDLALRAILEEAAPAAIDYYHLYFGGYVRDLPFPGEGDEEHERVITVFFSDFGGPYIYLLLPKELPRTAAELRVALTAVFSERVADEYMSSVETAENVTRDESGITVKTAKTVVPMFLELDGRLYRFDGYRGGSFGPEWTTAKVVAQTETEITFVYLGYTLRDTLMRAALGRLVYEDGWKFDWYDFTNPIEDADYREYYPELCGCTTETDASVITSVATTTTEATTVPESEAPAASLLSREEVVEIVSDLLERNQELDRLLHIEYQEARDESGSVIFYDGKDFTAKEPEEDLSGEWSELIEFEFTKAGLIETAEALYTEKIREYTKDFINEEYHEENGKLYRRVSDSALPHFSYYPETLEIEEQTESLISIECKGYNDTYEQQLFVSLTAVLEDGAWKIDALSYH